MNAALPPAETLTELYVDTVLFGLGENQLGARQNKSCVGHSKTPA